MEGSNQVKAPDSIIDLIERFERNIDAYRSGAYNETQVRREFIDPFFKALGWDVDNERGYAEAYKDVVHEDSLKTGDTTKAPDYSFRIGGQRKFFVEAKKPSIDIRGDIHPAFQLRRYAWSAKLPLSILTDFEEFAVYDCRVKPASSDKAGKARIKYIKYSDYIEKWDEIVSIFSRDAILKGSFDRFADSTRKKRGTAEVDDAFLEEIESWRDSLARHIPLRNPKISQRELNYAVQVTIDRLIFLRICEDRGIEPYGRLRDLLVGSDLYKHLVDLFHRADERYNSGLFHFKKETGRPAPDTITPRLKIDDKVLKDILRRLYYPDSPYEFSVLPADILGQIYERFLGKVIRLTPGHRAKVEEKPEVRKAGGVYYTPTYIVDYIVKNTVGKLLDGKSPTKIKNIRVLDPACGSGSFLIGAYQFLLDWHLKYYSEHNPEKLYKKKIPPIFQSENDEWKLATSERKRILLDHIFGVDIDTQAVEVTKLSLLLKVLEDESRENIDIHFRLFHERALPDLSHNIKCGNSLIGPDFYDNAQMTFLDDDERYRINVFDWRHEFPDVFKGKNPGFDAVIGNPPYSGIISETLLEYFSMHYLHQDYQKDLYLLFLERYEHFLRNCGLLGIIVSNTWLQSVTFRRIRQYLTSRYEWLRILHLPEKVFRAIVDTHVLIFQKSNLKTKKEGQLSVDIWENGIAVSSHSLPWQYIASSGESINIIMPVRSQELFRKIQDQSTPLNAKFDVYNGMKPFEVGKGVPPQSKQVLKEKPYVREGVAPDSDWSPLLRGSLIRRYQNLWNKDYWVLYGPWLAAPRDPRIFETPLKIMVRQTGDSITATLVECGFIARDNLHIILPKGADLKLCYVLGIINSKLTDFVYSFSNPEKGEALAQVKKKHVEGLLIRPIDFSDPADKARHDRMVELVDHMLELHRQLNDASSPHEKEVLQRQITATDNQIDRLVYELYDLTEEEIKIVEDGTTQG